MKKILKYLSIGLFGVLCLSSCSNDMLETEPTTSLSGSTLLGDADKALIPLNGIYRSMYTVGWSTTGNYHQCFGISAYNLMAEVMGDDFIMSAMGSGWFWYDAAYNVKDLYTRSTWRSYDLWNAYYTWIANANYLIGAEETMEGAAADKNYVVGQAYAIRAYSYFMLAQIFARTYKGHETEACVPITTEPTFTTTTGKARSRVDSVYAQITKDINKACELLSKDAANKTRQDNAAHMGYAVAQGIKARIALVMEDWSTAVTAAEEAIANSNCSILPVSSFIGMNDVSVGNVMWGADIVADQAGKYASLFAHMSTDVAYGKSAHKQITTWLYDKMSENDARLAWWDPTDTKYSDAGYIQRKFDFSNLSTWEGDYVWMRVEEMYLTAAEAYCRMGNESKAKEKLMDLMKNRDASYSCDKFTGTSLGTLTTDMTGSLLEEILLQRRIELWGEDGRVYTIRRLHQGFERPGDYGWPSALQLSYRALKNPENYMWVLTIPQAEFDGNPNMDVTKDQNPTSDE